MNHRCAAKYIEPYLCDSLCPKDIQMTIEKTIMPAICTGTCPAEPNDGRQRSKLVDVDAAHMRHSLFHGSSSQVGA